MIKMMYKTTQEFFEAQKNNESNHLPFNDNSPFYYGGLINAFNYTYGLGLQKLIVRLKEYDNNQLRMAVIETWLVIDYTVRYIIGAAFHFEEYVTNNFDPYYKILPSNTSFCIEILTDLLRSQKELSEPIETPRFIIKGEGFFDHVLHQNRDFFNELLRIETEYCKSRNIPLISPINLHTENKHRPNPEWYRFFAEIINKEWLKKAKKINKIRNKAAHEFNLEKIFIDFGIKGDEKHTLVKKYLIAAIKELTGTIEI